MKANGPVYHLPVFLCTPYIHVHACIFILIMFKCRLVWRSVLDQGTSCSADCTLKDMMKVLAHSLSVIQYPLVNKSEVSQLGLVSILLGVTTCVGLVYFISIQLFFIYINEDYAPLHMLASLLAYM